MWTKSFVSLLFLVTFAGLSRSLYASEVTRSAEGYLTKEDSLSLCAAQHYNPGNGHLESELRRRDLFNNRDRTALVDHLLNTGMSECGVFAVAGFPYKSILNFHDERYGTESYQISYLYWDDKSETYLFVCIDDGVVRKIFSSVE